MPNGKPTSNESMASQTKKPVCVCRLWLSICRKTNFLLPTAIDLSSLRRKDGSTQNSLTDSSRLIQNAATKLTLTGFGSCFEKYSEWEERHLQLMIWCFPSSLFDIGKNQVTRVLNRRICRMSGLTHRTVGNSSDGGRHEGCAFNWFY